MTDEAACLDDETGGDDAGLDEGNSDDASDDGGSQAACAYPLKESCAPQVPVPEGRDITALASEGTSLFVAYGGGEDDLANIAEDGDVLALNLDTGTTRTVASRFRAIAGLAASSDYVYVVGQYAASDEGNSLYRVASQGGEVELLASGALELEWGREKLQVRHGRVAWVQEDQAHVAPENDLSSERVIGNDVFSISLSPDGLFYRKNTGSSHGYDWASDTGTGTLNLDGDFASFLDGALFSHRLLEGVRYVSTTTPEQIAWTNLATCERPRSSRILEKHGDWIVMPSYAGSDYEEPSQVSVWNTAQGETDCRAIVSGFLGDQLWAAGGEGVFTASAGEVRFTAYP